MKLFKNVLTLTTALAISASVLCSTASAESWSLYHSQGAPTSDICTYKEILFKPSYTGRLGGYCDSYTLSSGNVRTKVYRVTTGSDGTLYRTYVTYDNITSKGACDIRNSIISPNIYCMVSVNFTDEDAYGSVTGRYK